MTNLRTFLKQLQDGREVLRVEEEVSERFDVASILKAFDGKVVMFSRTKEHSTPLVGGICGTRERLSRSIESNQNDLVTRLSEAIEQPKKPEIVSDGPVLEHRSPPDMRLLPILTHYEKDAGPYITSGAVYAKTKDDVLENVSIHRFQLLDENHLAIRIVPRHLYRLCQIAKERGDSTLDISISIGLHPAILLAASSPVDFGVSHYDVANTLLKGGLKLVKCPDIDAYAPSEAELVIEGKIRLDKNVPEGPFTDLTGTYDIQRMQPLVEVVGIYHRENYIYQALLPAGSEHRLLMGIPQETRIWKYVKAVLPTVKGVNMTLGGCGWLHCVVSVEKFRDGDAKNVIMAIFAANPSIKHAIVVDSDIDVTNMNQVEWAIATRFRGDRGLLIIPNVRTSSLDPTADQELELGCKVGIDATRPFSKPKEKFELAQIKMSPEVETIIKKISDTW
ncbi:MAG: UbiD family decarboxylase [Candidatus Bathyarchaeia archaeon]